MFELDVQNIALIIFGIIIIYLLYKTRNVEGFTVSDDIKAAINEVYMADIDAIRNLSSIANEMTTNNDTLTIPAANTNIIGTATINGNTNISADMTINGNTNISGQLIVSNKNILNELNELKNTNSGSMDGYIIGPFKTTSPVNIMDGIAFNVPITGKYILNVCASAYNKVAGLIIIQIWINGVDTGRILRVWTNETYSHKTLTPISFQYMLNAGTNYLYLKQTVGTSDMNDAASFSFIY